LRPTYIRPILEKTLVKAYEGIALTAEEISFLLELQDERSIAQLFEAARSLRDRYFGRKVFLYGFLYFSTWCRNHCAFCYYRISNSQVDRYRKSVEEIAEAARDLAVSGVHLIDLTMGEDPFYYQDTGHENLLRLVQTVKATTSLPLMISPGAVSPSVLARLAGEGVDWFACYQETHNPDLYRRLRFGQDYHYRMNLKYLAKTLGLLIEEGILTGVGETVRDLVCSIRIFGEMGAHQLRVMSFVPQAGTPMGSRPSPPRTTELKIIAVLRLLYPDRLIPASLDIDGISGLKERMAAGANVVTSLIPPRAGLLGVSNSSLDINDGYRTAGRVISELAEVGLEAASREEYLGWLERARKSLS